MADKDYKKIGDEDEVIEIPDLGDEVSEQPLEEQDEVQTATSGHAERPVDKSKSGSRGSTSRSSKKTQKEITKEKTGEHTTGQTVESQDISNEDAGLKDNRFRKLWKTYLSRKKQTIPITVLVVIGLLMAVPLSRYGILGMVIRQKIEFHVVDAKTGKGVSESEIIIAGKRAKTDGNGKATVAGVRLGKQKFVASKKYYKDFTGNALVPLMKHGAAEARIEATGRQVPISVTNSISGKAVKGVSIKAGETQVLTDEKGEAILVLSPNAQEEKAVIKSEGYNDSQISVEVTEAVTDKNKFTITPAGKIYFLSKQSGKIDVVKTNLDGSSREIVLAGTGNEDENNTSLLASRDWEYLALHAKREDKAKLFLIETATDKLTVIDEGDATFVPAGWSNKNFVYTIYRNNLQRWQSKLSAVKSFNAETKQLKIVDETQAEGTSDIDYAGDAFSQVYILENELVYYKSWSADYYSGGKIVGKKNTINSARPDGSEKKILKEFEAKPNGDAFINAQLYEPQEVYFKVTTYTQDTFYKYEKGKIEDDATGTSDKFNASYPTFLISPSGSKTFWYEARDGKNTLFIGDRNADDKKEIVTLSEFRPYGWFSDDYILESKNGSELFIGTITKPEKPLKISDYHKPTTSFSGYGYGYGGQ